MENFRTNPFIFPFSMQDESGNIVKFQKDDIIMFGIKENIYMKECILKTEMIIDKEKEEIQIKFGPEDTFKLDNRSYITEFLVIRDNEPLVRCQGEIQVKGVVIEYVPKDNSNTETTTENNSQA